MNKLWLVLMAVSFTTSLEAMDEDRKKDEACRVLQKNIRQHMSRQRDMYEVGLQYRDGKVDGYPKERFDTYALAGWHFLPLAWAGDVKAQHNFAWIKFEQEDFWAAHRWYNKAANQGFEPSVKNLQRVREEMAKCIWKLPNEVLLMITSNLGGNDLLKFRASAKLPAEFVEVTFKNRSQVQTPLVCLREHPHPITISYFLRENMLNIWKISIEDILRKTKTFLQCADFCKIYNYKGEGVFRYLGSINSKSPPSWEELNRALENKLFMNEKSDSMDDQELALLAYGNKINRFPDDEKIIDSTIKLAKEIIDKGGKTVALPCILGYTKLLEQKKGLTHPNFIKLTRFGADQGDTGRQVTLGTILVKEELDKKKQKKSYSFKDAKSYLEKAVQSRDYWENQVVVGWNWREGLGYAFYNLSLIAFEEGELEKADGYSQQGADLGNAMCQYEFSGVFEREGKINDAIRYLWLSAQQGFQPAIECLPAMIARSMGAPRAGG
jgi:hypothetical protein